MHVRFFQRLGRRFAIVGSLGCLQFIGVVLCWILMFMWLTRR